MMIIESLIFQKAEVTKCSTQFTKFKVSNVARVDALSIDNEL